MFENKDEQSFRVVRADNGYVIIMQDGIMKTKKIIANDKDEVVKRIKEALI